MRRILIILIVTGLAGYGGIAILRGPARSFTASLFGEDKRAKETLGSSFAEDKDKDGLSDAKENIYGTNSQKPDSDGDGFKDGEEVKKGFDPTLPGSTKISDNKTLMANLTVQYFEWARAIANAEDPQLNDEVVRQFLQSEGLIDVQMPTIADNELVAAPQNGSEAIKTYMGALSEVRLPDATVSYIDLADEIVRNKKSEILDDVVAGMVSTYESLRKIPAPQEMREVHRQQLALLKALRDLFSDLYQIERDPVMLVRDIAWGNDLLQRSVDLEKQRLEIVNSIQ